MGVWTWTYINHDDYWAGLPEWNKDESYLDFTVHGHSDQRMGVDWEEDWRIDREDKIYDTETTHNSWEEFKNSW